MCLVDIQPVSRIANCLSSSVKVHIAKREFRTFKFNVFFSQVSIPILLLYACAKSVILPCNGFSLNGFIYLNEFYKFTPLMRSNITLEFLHSIWHHWIALFKQVGVNGASAKHLTHGVDIRGLHDPTQLQLKCIDAGGHEGVASQCTPCKSLP